MSKRNADSEMGEGPLKAGERPEKMDVDMNEMGEFEDEFEDEFESDNDEILEAGVDGRPDAEREAEEKAGELTLPIEAH
jgi:ribosome assembly protein RRB1